MKRDGNTISLELDTMTARLLVRLAEMWGVSVDEAFAARLNKRMLRGVHYPKSAGWKLSKNCSAVLV